MTEYFRKDVDRVPAAETLLPDDTAPIEVQAAEVDRIKLDPINRNTAPDPDRRPLIVPPAAESSPGPAGAAVGAATGAAVGRAEERIALFVPNESNELRARWDRIQVDFVDQPRKAVKDADALVSATMGRLAEIFSAERQKLERQWEKDENISTEDLRLTLQRYRSFFGRLLSI